MARELGTSVDHLEYLCDNVQSYYRRWEKPKKGSSGTRTITASQGPLKKIQARIKDRLLVPIPLPDLVRGGRKGQNNASNAETHQGKKFHFVTDIRSFYPSISHRAVYDMLVANEFSADCARILTRLNTLEGELPQGIPTSTHIANLVFRPVDRSLATICEEEGITYTRYVDDLAFSSPQDFKDLSFELIEAIEEGGFAISHEKTHYKIGPVTITGIDVENNRIQVEEACKQRLEDLEPGSEAYEALKRYIESVEES